MWQTRGLECVTNGCKAQLPGVFGWTPPEIYAEHGWVFTENFSADGGLHWDGHCWCPEHEDEALEYLAEND